MDDPEKGGVMARWIDTPRLDRSVGGVARRARRLEATEHAGRWLGLALAAGGGAMVIDALGPLAWWVRVFVLASVALAGLLAVVLVARAVVRCWSVDERRSVLAEAEAAWSIAPSTLRSADELSREAPDDGIARALASRVVARTEAVLAAGEPLARVGSADSAKRAWILPACAAVLLVVFGVIDASALRITAMRLVDPLGDHPPVAPTTLVVRTGDAPLLIGDRATIVVTTGGDGPRDVWLTIDDDPVRIATTPEGGGVWSAEVGPITARTRVRAHSQSAYSRAVTLDPLALARVVGASVRVRPPRHAEGLAPVRDVSGDVAAVEGSTVEIMLRTSILSEAVIDDRGESLGDASGRTITFRRAVDAPGAVATWSFTPVSEVGRGPEAWTIDVRTHADGPPVVRFLGEGVEAGVLRLREGARRVVGVTSSDDVALASVALAVEGVPEEDVRITRLDHAAARGVVTVDSVALGLSAGDERTIWARASDTVPGRGVTEAVLTVRVISDEEARRRAMESATIESLTAARERAASAARNAAEGVATDADAERALRNIEESTNATAFEEEAAVAARGLRERTASAGVTRRDALEAERTLGAPARTLALADALQRAAERLALLAEAQRSLAVAAGERETEGPLAGAQRAHADRLAGVVEDLERLGGEAITAPMDADRLAVLRGALSEVRDGLEQRASELAGVEGAGRAVLTLRDVVITDLHFATDGVLERDAAQVGLIEALGDTERVLTRLDGLVGRVEDDPLREGVGLVREIVLAIGREAAPPLPTMGASALLLADRIDTRGIEGVMRDAARVMDVDRARGAELAEEAADLLDGLRTEAEDAGDAQRGVDAPLSLDLDGASAVSGSSSSLSPSEEGGAGPMREALDLLARNRARERGAGGEEARSATDGAEQAGDAAAGGGVGGEGAALGGRTVDADDAGGGRPVERPEDRAASASWIVEETVDTVEGEAERLARIPEAYREIVAAYLRAVARESGGSSAGRIGE